jgi:hypothetical protein
MEIEQEHKFRFCPNCEACVYNGQWRTRDGKLRDIRQLSARVCSLKVNQSPERQRRCINPFKGEYLIDPKSEFGFPDIDKLEGDATMLFNYFRAMRGEPPMKLFPQRPPLSIWRRILDFFT